MIIVSPTTLWNPAVLETRTVPKRLLGRVLLLPRRGLSGPAFLRLLFEMQLFRYLLPLIPFLVAMFVWPHLALPIAQAPVLMIMAVAFVEMRVLSLSRAGRADLICDSTAERVQDALRFNAQRLLTRLAARHKLNCGEILLVIEQSELARIAPLTLVSVQQAEPEPRVLPLDPQDRALIAEGLFDAQVTEGDLHRIAQRDREPLHRIALDVAGISAHARMTALLEAQRAPPAPETQEAAS